jgi:hypothetical protein
MFIVSYECDKSSVLTAAIEQCGRLGCDTLQY